MKKVTDLIKKMEMMPYQYANLDMATNNTGQMPKEENDENIVPVPEQGMRPYHGYYSPEKQREMEEKLRLIQEAQFSQIQTDAGTVYTYQIPSIDEISFNVAFFEGKMVIGTSQNVATDLIREFRGGNVSKLVASDDFQNATKNIYAEGYSKGLIKPLGVWNGMNYYLGKMEANLGLRPEDKEMISAIGTILKTINSISAIETASPVTESESMNKSAVFLEIKEVGQEEKLNAERILEKH